MARLIVSLIIFNTILSEILSSTDKIVCYHGAWSTYRPGNGKFTVEDIDPLLCTHLIYSFVGLKEDGTVTHLDSNLDVTQKNLNRFNALKNKNKNLKTLLAVGGFNEGSIKYSNVVSSSSKRSTFVKSALNIVQKFGFDGFDLDWEYPGQRGGSTADKANFVSLLKEFRKEFDKHGLLLTAAVAATSGSVDISYDIPALSQYLDLINVMAYDLHGPWDGVTGQNAPLYPSSTDLTEHQKLLTVDAAIRGWIQKGANPQKIALGLGVYGKTFTLSNAGNNKIGAGCSGPGNMGRYTQEAGMLSYYEIVEMLKEKDWTTIWDEKQKVPYSYKGNQWIGYDNLKSVAEKVEYAKSLNLGGVMIWTIDTEDFRGIGGTKFPILKTINNILEKSISDVIPEDNEEIQSEASAPEIVTEVILDDNNNNVISDTNELCQKEGYVRDPKNCNIFYYCLLHNGNLHPIEQHCNAGLVFDEENLRCDYPHLVNC